MRDLEFSGLCFQGVKLLLTSSILFGYAGSGGLCYDGCIAFLGLVFVAKNVSPQYHLIHSSRSLVLAAGQP